MEKRRVQEEDGESGRRRVRDTRESEGDRREDKKKHRKLQRGKEKENGRGWWDEECKERKEVKVEKKRGEKRGKKGIGIEKRGKREDN